MSDNNLKNEIARIILEHKTNYCFLRFDEMKWSCICGEEDFLPNRDACVKRTADHWADKIHDMLAQERQEFAADFERYATHDEQCPITRRLDIPCDCFYEDKWDKWCKKSV
jgi:hypothetical protein